MVDVKKKCVGAVLMVAVLLMASVLPALAATTGQSSGSFELGNEAPQVVSVNLLLEDENTDANNQMTPQTEYALKIVASDANGYGDISKITVYIYYDANGDGADEPGSDNPQTQATYQWTSSGGWTFVGPAGSTWGIDTAADQSRGPVSTTTTTGTWYLHFIPGKVATQSDEDDSKWIIKVVVEDGNSASDSMKDTDNEMQWYGEIQVDDGSFDFGSVNLGSSDNPITTPNDHNIDITTVSNGQHKIQAKTDAQWSSGGNNVNVNTVSESPGAGEITIEHFNANDETSAAIVQTSYTDVQGLTSIGQTSETGTTSEIYMWLTVGSEGIMSGTYTGTYYVQIANA
ncbi:hypothetical protein Asulf_01454 [Archaeoglobus sulfaticallidus PM70-1]|uniref:Uncharacterized protein n=1 Tax=Archaeoglobus sulfaticallidus PM70-1 TaxID=387631 RepID=N0BGM9_9EURY|nr:hypothetical protein [Archaeoglobus sulfaticallidus]AGK61437.1 hypothetical protein Asulf_01454 [Archaeoglobus sulfaticallidus PM70-1]